MGTEMSDDEFDKTLNAHLRPPSMDDKDTPSPPSRSAEKYELDKIAGINPWGRAYDRTEWALHVAACKELGLDPEVSLPFMHLRTPSGKFKV